jgi:hypothetical protein
MTPQDRLPPRLEPPKIYPPDILPMMRSLLRILADLDHEYGGECEALGRSRIPEAAKQGALETLRQCHRERRAVYLREMSILESRIRQMERIER